MEELDPDLVVRYDRLYRLEAGSIPNFSLLQQVSLGSDGQVPSSKVDTVRHQLDPLRLLCRARGWYPLITEFALISDIRREERSDREFTSFVRLALPQPEEVAACYIDALHHMKTEAAASTQIVPHRQLFRNDMGLIRIQCSSLVYPEPKSSTTTPVDYPDDYVTGTRANYIMYPETSDVILPSVTTQATVFVRKLLANIRDNPALTVARQLAETSTLLILPFVRPPAKTTTKTMRGEPGGALFLFLTPDRDAAPIEDLGRDLAWVLAEARDQQSDASLQAEVEQRRAYRKLLRVFGHGVTNQLKAAGLVGLREQAATHTTLASEDVIAVLDLLWPVWGIGDLSRIAAMNAGELRLEWLALELRDHIDDQGYLITEEPKNDIRQSAIRALVISRLAALCAANGDPAADRYRFTWNGDPITSSELAAARPTPIWPFVESEFLEGTTLVSLGLFELLANAMKYFTEGGFGSDPRQLDLTSTISGQGVLSIQVSQAAIPGDWRPMLRGDKLWPESRTINEIRNTVETKLQSERGSIVETGRLVVSPDAPRFETTWMFDWRSIRWKADT